MSEQGNFKLSGLIYSLYLKKFELFGARLLKKGLLGRNYAPGSDFGGWGLGLELELRVFGGFMGISGSNLWSLYRRKCTY